MDNIKLSESVNEDNQIKDDKNIMEKIEELTRAPIHYPNKVKNGKNKEVSERVITHRFRFPKVQNHPYCDSCSEYGDLLNCDRCAASFHLQCHDPPLDEETVPKGQWLCWRCQGDPQIFEDLILPNGKEKEKEATISKRGRPNKISEKMKRIPVPTKVVSVCLPHLKTPSCYLPDTSTTTTALSNGNPPADSCPPTSSASMPPPGDTRGFMHAGGDCGPIVKPAPAAHNNGNGRGGHSFTSCRPQSPPPATAMSVRSSSSNCSSSTMSDCDGSPPTPPPNAKPPVLVKEVDVMDGLVRAMNKQNPVEFSLPKHLVQDYAMPGSEKRLDAGTKFREADQKLDSDGMVPLPAKFCYSCGKTCRISPLIQCDYCSLLYHTECLNPPMNSLPSERWMCPNHIQNFIDDTMLTDNSKFTDKIAVYSKWNAIGRVDQEAIQLDFLSKVHQKNPPFSKKVYIPVKNPTKVPECVKQMYKKSSIERMRRIEAASYKTDKKKQEEWLYSMVKLQIDIADRIHCQSLPSLLTSPTSSTTSTTTTTATTTSTFLAACSIDTATSTTTTATSTTTSTSIDTTTTTTLEVVPSSSTPHETAGNTCLAICRSDATAPQPFSSSSSSLTSCSSTSVTSLPSSSSSSSSTYDTYLKSKFSRESCPPTANIPVVDATGLMGVTSSSNNNATTVGGAPAVVVDPTVTSGPVVLADTRPCESGTSSSTPDTGPSPAGNIIATGEAQAGTSEVTGEQAEASINTHAIPMDVTPATTSEPTTTTSDPNDTTTIPGAITMDIPTPEDNGGDSSSIGVVENQSLANNNGLSFGEKTRCTSQDTSSSPMDVEPTPSPTPSTSVAVISTPSSDAITNNSSSSGSSSGSGDRREATSFDPPHLTASPSSPPPASPTSHDQSIAENEEQTKHMNNIMKLDYKTICLLAAQRFKQLQPAKKMDEFPEEVITNTRKAKAIICPIDIPMNPVLMMTRTLKIGKGTDNDICLDNFGVCDYVSDNQAYIYFDQIERSYELLNNSEFGSMVDGAVYGLSPSSSPDLSDIGDGKDKLMLLKEKLKEPEPDPNVKPAMKSVKKKNSETCCCASGGLLLASDHTEGWEGAVVLHNHSRLQFGCLRFRFAYI